MDTIKKIIGAKFTGAKPNTEQEKKEQPMLVNIMLGGIPYRFEKNRMTPLKMWRYADCGRPLYPESTAENKTNIEVVPQKETSL